MSNPQTSSPTQQIIERLQAPVPDLDTLLALLATPLDALNLLPPQFRKYSTSDKGSTGIDLGKHTPQIQRAILTHIAPTWGPSLGLSTPSSTTKHPQHALLLTQYFCPDAFSNASTSAGNVAMIAYGTLVSTPLSKWGLDLLRRLSREYPIDRMFRAVFDSSGPGRESKVLKDAAWEDCVRNMCMVPDKVANYLASPRDGADSTLPVEGESEEYAVLENGAYFNNLSIRFEDLVVTLSSTSAKDAIAPLTYLLIKLVNRGVFPPKPPIHLRSQPSFFLSILPTVRRRTKTKADAHYSAYWASLIRSVPSELAIQSILASLFGCLTATSPEPKGRKDREPNPLNLSEALPALDPSPTKRGLVKREAGVLATLLGDGGALESMSDIWSVLVGLIVGRQWSEDLARVFVCWFGSGGTKALPALLDATLEVWASTDHIKHSLLSRHRYVTTLLLTTISYLPRSSPTIKTLSTNSHFIKGVGTYISHLDPAVRRCGMLVGEVIAEACGSKLEFGDWDGEDAGKGWCRTLRALLKERDVDYQVVQEAEDDAVEEERGANKGGGEVGVEEITTPAAAASLRATPAASQPRTVDSDDEPEADTTHPSASKDSDDESLEGYASPASSRSVSPTPSELDEIEKDPSLNVGKKKVARPVYLLQVGDLLRGTGLAANRAPDAPHEADRIDMALDTAEELVRRKRDYGTELDENAVDLAISFLGLTDRYESDGFAVKRQGILNALVACAPKKAPPALIEQFFKNQYSVDQRFVVLNALAIGARELASLPIPPLRVAKERTEFASKQLPPNLHRKYIQGNTADRQIVPTIMNGISRQLLSEERATSGSAPAPPPEYARMRKLRITKEAPKITPLDSSSSSSQQLSLLEKPSVPLKTRFIDVAAEYFIVPFIHAFWTFLRDEHTREERTASLPGGRSRYYGAGTGMILNAFVLAQFLRTMGVLVHASRNAPEWLNVIAPEGLELAVSIGTRPISRMDTGGDDEDDGDGDDGRAKSVPGASKTESKEASVWTSALELALVVLDGCVEVDGGRTLGLEYTALLLGVNEWAGKVFEGMEKGLTLKGAGGLNEASLSRAAAGVLLKVDEITSKWGRSMLDTR